MTKNNPFCEITPELEHLSELSAKCSVIDPELYSKYDVKRGLRDINGKGVLVGLTEISDVCSTKIVDGVSQPADGELYYRGYNVKDIIAGIDEKSHSVWQSSNKRRAKRIHEHAEQIPHTAYQFCTRHHHESAEQGYDEHPCTKCIDTLLLR